MQILNKLYCTYLTHGFALFLFRPRVMSRLIPCDCHLCQERVEPPPGFWRNLLKNERVGFFSTMIGLVGIAHCSVRNLSAPRHPWVSVYSVMSVLLWFSGIQITLRAREVQIMESYKKNQTLDKETSNKE